MTERPFFMVFFRRTPPAGSAYEQDEDTELGGNTRMAQVSASANSAETMPTAASQNGGAPRAMRMSRVAMT